MWVLGIESWSSGLPGRHFTVKPRPNSLSIFVLFVSVSLPNSLINLGHSSSDILNKQAINALGIYQEMLDRSQD